jgi:Phage DNA Adenine Methylase-like domain 1/Phage GNAT-like domain
MSFTGSINDKLRKFFWTHAGVLEGRKCYIGCSGNFTIEQIISRRCDRAEIYSNDISLYSSALGHMLAGLPFRMEVINPELSWANRYIERDGPERIATLLLLLEMLKYEKRKNPFAERMWQTYLINFEGMMEKTADRVKRAAESIRVKEYTMTDVFEYYPRPAGVNIGFLPTYVGGYEKLFQRLDESVDWDRPAYDMLTTERREETLQKMMEGDYILYDDQPRDLPCVARVDLFGRKTVFIYSNLFLRRGLFRKKITEKVPRYDILMPDEQVPAESQIRVKEVDISTINHYRNMYLSKKIQPGSGGPCFLVFAGDKLFGFLIFQAYSKKGGASNEIYLLSDFVVPSNRHRRLAKLLLLAATCPEMKQVLDEMHIRDYASILTTAFTDRPVSMKYRGVFDLAKRGEGFLNYRGTFGETTFKEVVLLWMKKYEKR